MSSPVVKETNDYSELMSDVSQMSALVEQTETDLSRANTEGQLIENNLRTLRKRLEKQSTQKIEIEEKILELLQDQITTDSAGNISGKLLREIQGQRRNAELNMYTTEYQLSQVLLELEKWKGQLSKSRENADRLNVSFCFTHDDFFFFHFINHRKSTTLQRIKAPLSTSK